MEKVAWGDFDLALKLIDNEPLRGPHAVGNVMWWSPEAQSGRGIAKPSDVFSLGLVVSYLGKPSTSQCNFTDVSNF